MSAENIVAHEGDVKPSQATQGVEAPIVVSRRGFLDKFKSLIPGRQDQVAISTLDTSSDTEENTDSVIVENEKSDVLSPVWSRR